MAQTFAKRPLVAGLDVSRSFFALAILGLAACSDPTAPHQQAQRNLAAPCGVVTLCVIQSAKNNPLPKAYMDSIPIIRPRVYLTALLPAVDTTGICQCSSPVTSAPMRAGKP